MKKAKYGLLLAAALAASAQAQVFLDPQITMDAADCASGGPCDLMDQVHREEEERKAFWARQRQLAEEQQAREHAQQQAMKPPAHEAPANKPVAAKPAATRKAASVAPRSSTR